MALAGAASIISPPAQGAADGVGDVGGVGEVGERHEGDVAAEQRRRVPRGGHGQPGLARAARPGQRHQALADDQVLQGREIVVAPHEVGRPAWQADDARLRCPRGRERVQGSRRRRPVYSSVGSSKSLSKWWPMVRKETPSAAAGTAPRSAQRRAPGRRARPRRSAPFGAPRSRRSFRREAGRHPADAHPDADLGDPGSTAHRPAPAGRRPQPRRRRRPSRMRRRARRPRCRTRRRHGRRPGPARGGARAGTGRRRDAPARAVSIPRCR